MQAQPSRTETIAQPLGESDSDRPRLRAMVDAARLIGSGPRLAERAQPARERPERRKQPTAEARAQRWTARRTVASTSSRVRDGVVLSGHS